MRILLDENVPAGLKAILFGHDVCTAIEIGLAGVSNGKLLDAAEEGGFQILVTADANIRAQQRLEGRRIAMIVLNTTHWLTIREHVAPIIAACESAAEGAYIVVNLPKRPLRRRPPPSLTSLMIGVPRGVPEDIRQIAVLLPAAQVSRAFPSRPLETARSLPL